MTLHKLIYALISLFYLFSVLAQTSSELKSYIIHVKQHDRNIHTTNYHNSFLPAVTTSNDPLLYSYNHVISGFAARLTAEEVEAMKEKDGFISAHPERMYQLATTRSPSFLGLHPGTGLWNQSNEGNGVIIGVLDTGVFPSHPSFSGVNMPPPPAKWKGKCKFPNKTNCNNKLIGAQFFNRAASVSSQLDEETVVDQKGHGTHTASTAAGGFVENACVLGSACGTAVGMAPKSHLAIYKVCSQSDCSDIDLLAGLDAAVKDGVDIISLSLSLGSIPFHHDRVAIGTFAVVQKGILVSCSGGNGGPFKQSISNEAPWVLTVGASTIDRRLRATAKLGNGQVFDGESVYQPKDFPAGKMLPLVYGASCCKLSDVKGKVVLCDGSEDIYPMDQGWKVKDAGGAAAILANLEQDGFTTDAEAHVLPATEVSYMAGQKIKAYINSTKSPTATILSKGTVIGDPLAPIVAGYSSRGPSLQTPGVLKPDTIGPGVNILAAAPFHFDANTDSQLTFSIHSGTSMSTPHLSGVAALLKSAHPSWSPAAIKSAIMTIAGLVNAGRTAILDEKLTPADVFATGAGHVNPSKATDPGLVYDLEPDDYIPFLCGLGYTDKQVGTIAHKSVNCTSKIPQGQLNYPTFSVSLGSSQTFKRTVTNVGEPSSHYCAKIVAPKGVEITVKPRHLLFSSVNQKATYYVTFSRSSNMTNTYSQGDLRWVFKSHTVRSVISIKFTGEV
ncbi:subtilisin-like protease sdd1 [Phtheirospermum japonicum]|uniref:Subtilisin-like protease sdd1 n=1 Tax=Phtheirospermum japonicum TaxID=374723 RepID=A0A830B9R4_9LAMI|nr:subtilisin-like protease sdd1 [Phtheirospermum japonicum]